MNSKIREFVNGLSDEIKGKLKDAKNIDDVKKILETANVDIDPEILSSVAGGNEVFCFLLEDNDPCYLDKFTCHSFDCSSNVDIGL